MWGTYRHTLRRDPDMGWKVDGFAFFKTLERGDAEVPRIVPPG